MAPTGPIYQGKWILKKKKKKRPKANTASQWTLPIHVHEPRSLQVRLLVVAVARVSSYICPHP
jgi:hypothetical protein